MPRYETDRESYFIVHVSAGNKKVFHVCKLEWGFLRAAGSTRVYQTNRLKDTCNLKAICMKQ